MMGKQKMGSMFANPKQEDYAFLLDLFAAGKAAPVIDRCYPLSETAEAFRNYIEGRASGKIVKTVQRTI